MKMDKIVEEKSGVMILGYEVSSCIKMEGCVGVMNEL